MRKKGLIGKKLGMTQVYQEDGTVVPVTAIEVGPCTVLALRTKKQNNYSAIQLGFGVRKVKNVSKSVIGNVKAAGLAENPPAIIREIRLDDDPTVEVGAVLKADIFAAKEFVNVSGRTKGHGFAGVVKRWDFNGGRASHGGGWLRRSGSIGMREKPGKVYKGRHMAGHWGNVNYTSENLQVIEVRPEQNLLLVKGTVPGPNGGFVLVKNAVKK